MSEATSNISPGVARPPFSPEIIDLDRHPDGVLLRLCATLERLRNVTEDLERVAAALPTRTMLGRRMKELTL